MREWAIYLTCGACTSLGVMQAAYAMSAGPVFGGLGLFILFALWWLNTRLEMTT